MVNMIMEEWLEAAIGVSIRQLVFERGNIIPTVRLEAEFINPSILEDVLTLTLRLERIGKSSFTLKIDAICQDEARFWARPVIVFVDKQTGKSMSIPDDIRRAMEQFIALE